MGVDSSINQLESLCNDFNTALSRVGEVWDDKLSDRIQADQINQMTSCASQAIQELDQLRYQLASYMDMLLQLTY